jgi:hypothetical protein
MTVAFLRLFESRRFSGVSALLLGLALSASAPCGAAHAQQPAARAQPAAAQPGPTAGEPPGYAQIMDEAVAEYDLHHFAEARALFTRGLGLYPNARAYRGLGMAEFELRNYADSVENLQQALAAPMKPLEGELRAETERLLARARGFVGKINLAVEPDGATVVLDGTPVALGPERSLLIAVGDHIVEFRADGYRPETRSLKVRGGESETLRVVLTQEAVARSIDLTTTAQPPRDDDGRRPLYKNPWLWAGVGVGAAALATGLAIGLSGDDAPSRSPRIGTVAGP